ncbi:acyl-CoA dehydrogenase family protein [Kutzneria kofuensis]|uniref:Alkylation response protein AidB-like acyl-CoA dehydrogenase n=1 Tax=Kutzneria kofuensis TaxID=103725 RepID=A0A7W9KLL3_9PSEU|nr:acyl-CoA dehydrogenase family protein [Kutzneria kofuensis]MBB5894811.1 alkylation response protein AidB-like acyl-CoA dehydrogenase [Kutzneria kofuensis]
MIDELVACAQELTPLLAEQAAETERSGDVVCAKAMADAGMFSLFAPGIDADLGTAVDVLAALGRGCGSSAWVAMILSAGGALTSLLDDEVRDEVWGDDPKAAVASVMAPTATAERVPGGWRVSGQWRPASGVRHARWILLGVPIEPGPVQALVPTEQTRIVPTWSVSGMQGTGSETVVAEDVFVPERRLLSMARAMAAGYAEQRPNVPFATVPASALLPMIAVGPVLGMAEAALGHAIEVVRRRGPIVGTDYARAADSPAVQIAIARAAGLVDGARLHVDRSVRELTESMRAGIVPDPTTVARIRMDAGIVSENVRQAVALLLDVTGAGAFATSSPLQRVWRDIEVACRHQVFVPDSSREGYGRALLGID